MPIDFEHDLNPAQREAVETIQGPVLVIAGAGSGKTRTVVYRLAKLVNMGVPPENILLLTFTRKAAQEMLDRAARLLGGSGHEEHRSRLSLVSGGTFHAFAFSVLRKHAAAVGFSGGVSMLDRADSEDVLGLLRSNLSIAKSDKSFPKRSAVMGLISKSRNKEMALTDILDREAYHLAPHAENLNRIAKGYGSYKREHGLLDYDDLLFYLEKLLVEQPDLRDYLRMRYSYIMVDEYQDTNLVQARIVQHLAGEGGNIMAVGDDAQSIYAFRGANVENILQFPHRFPGAKIIRLEENYRSTQPILDITNAVLDNAERKFEKHLFTKRKSGPKPEIFRTYSDMTQARLVVSKVVEQAKKYPLHEIAVLFRAGYMSFPLEVELNKLGIAYQKFGGIKFSDAAHVKDALAYLRVAYNPDDVPGWRRILSYIKGIGPKTAEKIFEAIKDDDDQALSRFTKKNEELAELIYFVKSLNGMESPKDLLDKVIQFYLPLLKQAHPDDYPRREAGLEQLYQIAADYSGLDVFLAELVLENPEDDRKKAREDTLCLSTVHSAKGLEWSAVCIIDLVDDRFPSRHALVKSEDLEEERRLLYVAATRAREYLGLFVPKTVYQRQNASHVPVMPSLFLRELDQSLYREHNENRMGGVNVQTTQPVVDQTAQVQDASSSVRLGASGNTGYCRHKIFGRGKIIEDLGSNKYRVNFPGFGLKVIVGDYLTMESE